MGKTSMEGTQGLEAEGLEVSLPVYMGTLTGHLCVLRFLEMFEDKFAFHKWR